MTLSVLVGTLFTLWAIIMFGIYKPALRKSDYLTFAGLAVFFFSYQLAHFFVFFNGNYAPTEVVESWLFSFRALGASLFVWRLCDAFNQKVEALVQALKP